MHLGRHSGPPKASNYTSFVRVGYEISTVVYIQFTISSYYISMLISCSVNLSHNPFLSLVCFKVNDMENSHGVREKQKEKKRVCYHWTLRLSPPLSKIKFIKVIDCFVSSLLDFFNYGITKGNHHSI